MGDYSNDEVKISTISYSSSSYSDPKQMVLDNMLAMDSRSFYYHRDINGNNLMKLLVITRANSKRRLTIKQKMKIIGYYDD